MSAVPSLDVSTTHIACIPKKESRTPREIKIPVPFGHLAAKVWGPDDGYPVLAIHGWQENANSFDKLAPLLSNTLKIVCIDEAGCGESSPYPLGCEYTPNDIFLAIQRIVSYFGWGKFGLLGHSRGAGEAQLYAGTYPDQVEWLISLDLVKLIAVAPDEQIEQTVNHVARYINYETKLSKTPKPTYRKDEAIERLLHAEPSLTYESASILVERGTERVLDVNGEERYHFRRDIRLSYPPVMGLSFVQQVPFLRGILCPHMLIKAKDSKKYEGEQSFEDTKRILEENPNFVYIIVEGTHHVHINHPERVAPYINDFLLGRRIRSP